MGTLFDSRRQRTRLGVLVGCLSIGLVVVLAIALALPARAQPASSPWPMFHHDAQHTGQSTFDTSQNIGNEEWKFTTGGMVESSPAIGSDGTIYVGSDDDNLYAISPAGGLSWKFATGGIVKSSPAIATDGTIYVGSADANLYAINPSGSLMWQFTTGGAVYSSPTVAPSGNIYVGSADGNLYSINANGSENWDFATGAVDTSPTVGADGTLADGTIYVAAESGTLYGLNPAGQETLPPISIGADPTSTALNTASPLLLFVASQDFVCGQLCISDVVAYNLSMNNEVWWGFTNASAPFVAESSPAVGSDGTVYAGADDANLYAINGYGGKKWAFATGNPVHSSPAIGADGTVFVGSEDANLYAVTSSGSKKWAFTTGGDVNSSPAIATDGTIYVGSDDDNLYALGAVGTQPATPTPAPSPTSVPTATPTPTPTSTPAATPTPISTAISAPTPVAAKISATPTSLTFAARAMGTSSKPQTVTLTNAKSKKQNQTITVTGIGTSGDFAAPAGACVGSLAAGQECKVSVTFTPSAKGTRKGTLTITSNAKNPSLTISLKGTGRK